MADSARLPREDVAADVDPSIKAEHIPNNSEPVEHPSTRPEPGGQAAPELAAHPGPGQEHEGNQTDGDVSRKDRLPLQRLAAALRDKWGGAVVTSIFARHFGLGRRARTSNHSVAGQERSV